MRMPKHYGQSRIERCPFCERQGTIKNPQGVPVCPQHSKETLEGMKCVCGRDLFIQNGKFGVFFICTNCGNLTLRKVLEINSPIMAKGAMKTQFARQDRQQEPHAPAFRQPASGPKEVTIRSDELDF